MFRGGGALRELDGVVSEGDACFDKLGDGLFEEEVGCKGLFIGGVDGVDFDAKKVECGAGDPGE